MNANETNGANMDIERNATDGRLERRTYTLTEKAQYLVPLEVIEEWGWTAHSFAQLAQYGRRGRLMDELDIHDPLTQMPRDVVERAIQVFEATNREIQKHLKKL